MSRPPPRPPEEPQQPPSTREQRTQITQEASPHVAASSISVSRSLSLEDGNPTREEIHAQGRELSESDRQEQSPAFRQAESASRFQSYQSVDDFVQSAVSHANAAGFQILSITLAPAPRVFQPPSTAEQLERLPQTSSSTSLSEQARATTIAGGSPVRLVHDGTRRTRIDAQSGMSQGQQFQRQSVLPNVHFLSERAPPQPPLLPTQSARRQMVETDVQQDRPITRSAALSPEWSQRKKRGATSLPSIHSTAGAVARDQGNIYGQPTVQGTEALSADRDSPLKRRRSIDAQPSVGASQPPQERRKRYWGTVMPPFASDTQQQRPVLPPPESIRIAPSVESPERLKRESATEPEGTASSRLMSPSYRPSALTSSTFLRAAEHVRPRLSPMADISTRGFQSRQSVTQLPEPSMQVTAMPSPAHFAEPSVGESNLWRRRTPEQLPSMALRRQMQLTEEQQLQLERYQIPAHQSMPTLASQRTRTAQGEATAYDSFRDERFPLAQHQPVPTQPAITIPPQPSPPPSFPAFACEFCPSRFRRKSDRNRHVRVVHQKQRPFVCDRCQAAFGEKSNMIKHIRMVHENVRLFRCPHCSAKFGQRGNCDAHIRAVHEKNKTPRYVCPYCSKPFQKKSQLTEHTCEGRESYRMYIQDAAAQEIHSGSAAPPSETYIRGAYPEQHIVSVQQQPLLPPPPIPPTGAQYPQYFQRPSDLRSSLSSEHHGELLRHDDPTDSGVPSGPGTVAGPRGVIEQRPIVATTMEGTVGRYIHDPATLAEAGTHVRSFGRSPTFSPSALRQSSTPIQGYVSPSVRGSAEAGPSSVTPTSVATTYHPSTVRQLPAPRFELPLVRPAMPPVERDRSPDEVDRRQRVDEDRPNFGEEIQTAPEEQGLEGSTRATRDVWRSKGAQDPQSRSEVP